MLQSFNLHSGELVTIDYDGHDTEIIVGDINCHLILTSDDLLNLIYNLRQVLLAQEE